MKNTNNTRLATLAYIIITAVSLTLSYMVYEETLQDYNFGFAIMIFSVLSALSIGLVYQPIQRSLFSFLNIPIAPEEEGMSIKEAFKRQPKWIYLNGVLGAAAFCCLLPYLNSIDNAVLFIIIGSVGRLIQVPLSQLFLDDIIEKTGIYYIGLILCVLGTIYFQMSGCTSTSLGYSTGGLMSALVYLFITSFNSIIYKYGTVPKHVGADRFISVKCAAIIVQIIEAFAGLLVGAYLISKSGDIYDIIPTSTELLGLIVVGTIVPITYTLSARLTNHIDHSISRAADGLRIILGTLLAIVFSLLTGDTTFLEVSPEHKLLALIIICLGTYVSFRGNPGGIKNSKTLKTQLS